MCFTTTDACCLGELAAQRVERAVQPEVFERIGPQPARDAAHLVEAARTASWCPRARRGSRRERGRRRVSGSAARRSASGRSRRAAPWRCAGARSPAPPSGGRVSPFDRSRLRAWGRDSIRSSSAFAVSMTASPTTSTGISVSLMRADTVAGDSARISVPRTKISPLIRKTRRNSAAAGVRARFITTSVVCRADVCPYRSYPPGNGCQTRWSAAIAAARH